MAFYKILSYIIAFGIMIFVNVKKMEKNEKKKKETSAAGNIATWEKKTAAQKAVLSGEKQRESSAMPNVPRQKVSKAEEPRSYRKETPQPPTGRGDLWGEDRYARQRIVAKRLMEGDPVPQGYDALKCPYCGADNLKAKNSKQYHSCYFCRVPID